MTETMRKTVANIRSICDVAAKVKPYETQSEDLTEIITMMNYDSKIESIVRWITDYDISDPIATIPTVIPEKTETPQISESAAYTVNASTYSDFYTPRDITNIIKSFVPNEVEIEINSEPTETEDDTTDPPIEFDKEFIHYATYPDLDTTVADKVIAHYDEQKWLKQDKNAEWRRNEQYPIMVSDSGLFFDLIENKPIIPYWHAGEMFMDIVVNDERLQKRCGVMIATVFQLKRPPVLQNDTNVIDFKDNDRRNLRLDNLCYSRKSLKPSNTTLLLNDVCQRCIEHKFSAAKVASLYDGDDEIEITVDFVKDLISKKQRTDISDNYWKLDSRKKPVPVTPKLPSTSFVDVATVFLQGDTIENCEILLDTKIAGNYALSDAEKELLCNLAKKALPSTGVTYSNIAVYIVNNYKWEISANEVKRLMNNPTAVTQRFAEISAKESEAS